MDKQIIVYEPNEQLEMEVKTDGETVWMTQEQMCRLFGCDQSVIARHIKNVLKSGELPQKGFVQICIKPLEWVAGLLRFTIMMSLFLLFVFLTVTFFIENSNYEEVYNERHEQ